MTPMTRNRLFFVVQGVLKYLPFAWAVWLRGLAYPFFFRRWGRDVRILDNVTIKYPDQIELGDHVRLNEGCYVVGLGGLVIGDHAMVGAGTKIVTTSHNFQRTDIPMAQQGISAQPIHIGRDVWFGFDVKVLGGSTIGDGSIIAAGAVVPGGDFPAGAVLGGVPAKLLKNRFQPPTTEQA